MALDFPASPTLGQQFTAAGVTWTWDGAKWAAGGSGVAYLPLTGGTLTGNLTMSSAIPLLRINAATPNTRGMIGQTAGVSRWAILLGGTGAESGANAGSNFSIISYDDTGSVLSTPIAINRASGVVTIPNLSAPQAIGDNRIINGDMRIDQRNNGAGGTAINVYTIDRWQYGTSQAARGSWQRAGPGSPVTTGFPYNLSFTSSSAYTALAGDTFYFTQSIEADFVSDFAWGTATAQPVTLSFWVNSSLAGTFGGSITNAAGTRSYPFSYSLPTANVWTKIVINIPGDTAGTWVMSGNARALSVFFDLGCGSTYRGPANAWSNGNLVGVTGSVSVVGTNGAAFYVTGVKLEIGSVATPFNRQSLAKSLADCQRYYEVSTTNLIWDGYAEISNNYYHGSQFVVQKRAIPTITPVSTGNALNFPVLPSLNTADIFGVMVSNTCSATGAGSYWQYGWIASAEL